MSKNQYPLGAMADELERHGRFGDSQLVHLNPIEVAGLASLSPTGKLTVNPVTGKKEAFLPLLIPIIASYGGSALAASAGASMVGAAIAGGAASGLATYAQTGDAERGLYSGIMGAGMGAAAGAAGEAARGVVADPALAEGIAGLGTESLATDAIAQGTMGADATAFLDPAAGVQGTQSMGPTNMTPATDMTGAVPPDYMSQGINGLPDPSGTVVPTDLAPPIEESGGMLSRGRNMFTTGDGPLEGGFTQTAQDPFMAPEDEGMVSQMTKSKHLMPIALGGNQLMELNSQAEKEGLSKEEEKKRKAKLKNAYGDLQGAYGRAQPGIASGISPYRGRMSNNSPAPWRPEGMADGGIVRLGSGGRARAREKEEELAAQRGTGIDPVSVQAGLRGQYHVATEPGYMAGMQPEFNYFQNDLENIQSPVPFNQQQLNAPYNTNINRFAAQPPNTPYFKSAIPPPAMGPKKPEGMAGGGQIPVSMGGEQGMIQGGGIANVPTEYTAQPPVSQGMEPNEEDITLLASALMGENPDHADEIVEAFVDQYGPEKFAEIRQKILQMIQGPNAQTDGMIQGQGGGMDDQVMGTIGSDQPVAVSPGEYIVPADVVSGLGDGSSDAGAAELDRMQQDVRMARGGGTNQPPPIDARRYMPA